MKRKILPIFILFILCISSVCCALEYEVPVWSENGLVKEVSNEALRRKFFKYTK